MIAIDDQGPDEDVNDDRKKRGDSYESEQPDPDDRNGIGPPTKKPGEDD